MKGFIKGICFSFAVVFVIGATLVVFLYHNGFRITYAPNLENSWDAVSASAAWAGVAISFVAIIVAGYVALKQAEISEQQNKIALFERRYEVYEILSNVIHAAEKIYEIKNPTDIFEIFQIEFDVWEVKEKDKSNDWIISLVFNISKKLDQSEFLFSKKIYEKIALVNPILLLFLRGTYAEFDIKTFEKRKEMFFKVAQEIKSKNILEQIKKDLSLQSIKL